METNSLSNESGAAAAMRRLSSALIFQQELVSQNSKPKLAATIVDHLDHLVHYNKAIFFTGRKLKITAISNIAEFDRSSAFLRALEKAVRKRSALPESQSIGSISLTALLCDAEPGARAEIDENLLWIPLSSGSTNKLVGLLLLCRNSQWSESDKLLLQPISYSIAHAWQALSHWSIPALDSKRSYLILLALAALFLLPVKQSILVPAQLIPSDPYPITSPISSIIREIHVDPYQRVFKEEKLLSFDDTELKSARDVALSSLKVIEKEYESLQQSSFLDQDKRTQLAIWLAKLEEQQAVLDFNEFQLAQVQINAPISGVVVFDDPDYWTGRPVETGQRVMLIADPQEIEIRLDVPVGDLIPLEEQARVQLFLDINPARSYEAELEYIGYSAVETETSLLAYRGLAQFIETDESLRLGAKGTAKVYGQRVLLGFYLFRKPISIARQFFGV